MEAASGCPREQSWYRWRVSRWSICHRVGRRLWNSGGVFLSLQKDWDFLLPQPQNTPLVAGPMSTAAESWLLVILVHQLWASPSLPPQKPYSASLCSLVISKMMKSFWNFSGNRIFLEVDFQSHGRKTCGCFFERKVIAYYKFLLPSQKFHSVLCFWRDWY